MPDSPSIPATGWHGLPKRKARPLLQQVAGDRFRPIPPSAPWRPSASSYLTRRGTLALVILVIGAVLVFAFASSTSSRLDHLLESNTVLFKEQALPPDVWDALLFQDEESGSRQESLWEDEHDADLANSRTTLSQTSASTGGKSTELLLPFSCHVPQGDGSVHVKYMNNSNLFRRSLLYAGTGEDLVRIFNRAARLSKAWQSTENNATTQSAFRVMVIGGSVSNCRGVDRSLCWHSHIMRWLSNVFPLGDAREKDQISYRFVDLAKSATGSSFFSYCWKSELSLRKKDTPFLWGEGPDLVIIETGINDVVAPTDFVNHQTGQSYDKDFESLLKQLDSLPSQPAIVILEAASKLLARAQGFHQAAEFSTHLVPSVWMDVPVISAKSALMTPKGSEDAELLGNLFLADGHHPSVKGHEVLADLLISHFEEIACRIQLTWPTIIEDKPDSVSFGSFAEPDGMAASNVEGSTGECIQVGAAGEKRKPKKNRGFQRMATSRDKQYMASSNPGSKISYEVEVGKKGQILASWLSSRFYRLGEARFMLDERKPGVRVTGHWNLGWSIGVPTVIFEGVSPGKHTVTIEHLRTKGRVADGTSTESNFRLIALATT